MPNRIVACFAAVLAPAVLLTVLTGPASASIVVNGGFENPDIPTGSFSLFESIPGWVKVGGIDFIEIQDHAAGDPFEGGQLAEVNQGLHMAQTLTTVAGEKYDLSFAYSPRPNRPADNNGVSVFWDGVLLANITAIGSDVTVWSIQEFSGLTASSTSTELEFRGTGVSFGNGGYIDDVRVDATVIPEPATLAIWSLLATLGLSFYRRRRRRAF